VNVVVGGSAGATFTSTLGTITVGGGTFTFTFGTGWVGTLISIFGAGAGAGTGEGLVVLFRSIIVVLFSLTVLVAPGTTIEGFGRLFR